MLTLRNSPELLELPPMYRDPFKTVMQRMDADEDVHYDVFLGGSCGETQWRQNTVIPRLKTLGISFYNPQVDIWTENLIAIEERAKQHSNILLFVVDHRHLSVVSLIEIAYLAAQHDRSKRSSLLVVLPEIDRCCLGRSDCSNATHFRTEDHRKTHKLLKRILLVHHIPVCQTVSDALLFIEWKLIGTQPIVEGIQRKNTRLLYMWIQLMKLKSITKQVVSETASCLSPQSLYQKIQDEKVLSVFRPRTRTELLKLNLLVVELMVFFTLCFCCPYLPVLLLMGSIVLVHIVIQVLSPAYMWPQNSVVTRNSSKRPKRPASYDVYLGFSGEQTDWLTQIVLPQINKQGLSFIDSSYCDDSQKQKLIQSCSILLFIISSCTNFLSGLVELAYYVGLRWRVVGCIPAEAVTKATAEEAGLCPQTLEDYRRGLLYLHDMSLRSSTPVFDDVTEATMFVVERIKRGTGDQLFQEFSSRPRSRPNSASFR